MENLVVNPKILTFLTTYTCTSACKNCCFQCNPKRKEKLSIDEMKQYIDECVRSYDSLKMLVLTGGEIFVYGDSVNDIIRHASLAGLKTRIVTNGFWANDYQVSFQKIKKLIESGLNEINFSTGDDHLEFVSIDNIKNGVLASLRQNLTVAINVESADDRKFDSRVFFEDCEFKEYLANQKLHIVNGLWISFDQSIKRDSNASYFTKNMVHKSSYCKCGNIFTSITIDPNHRLLSCCGLTSKRIAYLDLGDVSKYSIKELYERQFNDFIKIWIATEGVHKIMDFISEYSDVNPNYKIEHPCQLCDKILTNPMYIQILKENYRKSYSNILFKYFINKKEIENENT